MQCNLTFFNITLNAFFIGFILFLIILYTSFYIKINYNNQMVSYNLLSNTGNLFIIMFIILIYLQYINNNIYITTLLIMHELSYFSNFIIIIFSILIIKLTINFFKNTNIKSYEYFLIFIISIIALFLIINSNNLLSIYINLELLSLSYYVLSSYNKISMYAIEAGFKYFILGSLSTGLLLLGSCYLYLSISHINLIYYNNIIFQNNQLYITFIIGLIIYLCGFLFKIGIIPFHT
jgi:NADH-quinone oxidoreductase subunit N